MLIPKIKSYTTELHRCNYTDGWVAHVSSACVLRLSHVTVAVTRCQLPRARRLSCMSVTCRLLCVSAVAREAVGAAVGIAV